MMRRKIKSIVAMTVFKALGRGMKGVYKIDSGMVEALDEFSEGYTVRIRIYGTNKKLVFSKTNGVLQVYKSKLAPLSVDLDLIFKNLDVALPLLLGVKSAASAYADSDFIMKGDICQSMIVVKIINLVESYLFPKSVIKRILNYTPKRVSNKARLYTYFMFGI